MDLDQTVIGIYVIKHPGADVDQLPEDVDHLWPEPELSN